MRFQEARGLESFTDACLEASQAGPDQLLEYEDRLGSADEILALDRDPGTEHLVRSVAFASLDAGDVSNSLRSAG
jgi:hypothetical protein